MSGVSSMSGSVLNYSWALPGAMESLKQKSGLTLNASYNTVDVVLSEQRERERRKRERRKGARVRLWRRLALRGGEEGA